MSIFLFRVIETYYSDSLGLILLPGLGTQSVPVGTPITIVKPDSTEIETKINSIAFNSSHSITVDKTLKKDDIPIGSEIWVKKSLTYDLDHYTLVNRETIGKNFEITFKHKVDETFLMKLTLSEIAEIIDNLVDGNNYLRLKIDMMPDTDTDIMIVPSNPEVKQFPKVLIFADTECKDVCFKGKAKTIDFSPLNK